ncbi:hypothetical protein EOM86_05765 [Candidatus Nomurabacteria bacterium]|nr:hypothetical protein [Candidatus Nomurabacteria bacterium]
MINWVFGGKAVMRYHAAYPSAISGSYDALRKSIFIDRDYLVKPDLSAQASSVSAEFVSEAEETTRSTFFGSDEGLMLCIDYTTMYHPASSHCPKCPNKFDCIEIMKGISINLYESRINKG